MNTFWCARELMTFHSRDGIYVLRITNGVILVLKVKFSNWKQNEIA